MSSFNFSPNPKRPLIMGILNITPDSFSDGGLYLKHDSAISHALALVAEGADILDIGGESTRPGSSPVGLEEELSRVIPVIEGVREASDVPISIDTTKSEVAARAIEAGANIVNDVSAARFDPEILDVVARSDAHLCLMHMLGTPENMQLDPSYEELIPEISKFLIDAAEAAIDRGVEKARIILDPGIGFGKSAQENVIILKELAQFVNLGYPILVGTSRKSFMGKLLGYEVNERLEGTLASLAVAGDGGASIVRVHDVIQSKRFLDAYALFR